MVTPCTHQTSMEIEKRWASPLLKDMSVEDLSCCPCCGGPSKVVIPVWGVNCSRCQA